MASLSDGKLFYRPAEVAEILDVSVEGVREWVRKGQIKHVRISPKVIRIPREEVEKRLQILGGD